VAHFSGVWEPKTFGFMVPNAPLSPAGQEIVTRNAAAMQGGKIMQTAWVSCRPGAVSTMTMPREKIVILESADGVTILFEMPRMVAARPHERLASARLAASYVGDSMAAGKATRWWSIRLGFNGYAELDARGQPTSSDCIRSSGSRHRPTAASTSRRRSRIPSTTRSLSPSSVRGRRARHGIRSSTTAWRIPRQEDFENAYYVRERYRPVCMRVEGAGMELCGWSAGARP
jgi:hypothetical protein